jgi:hypothetical protein
MKKQQVLLSLAALTIGLGVGLPVQADSPPWT